MKENKICCIGIGSRGTTAVNIMIEDGLKNVEFWQMDIENELSDKAISKNTIKIGDKTQKFADCSESAKATENAKADILKAIDKADLVFVVAGLGGNTGMGAAPVAAKIAKESGALTVGIVSMPYGFDGEEKMQKACENIEKIREAFDTLVVIPNDETFDASVDFLQVTDDAIEKSIQCITDIIAVPGLINIELKDIEGLIKSSGYSVVGMGSASGENRAVNAVKQALEFISLQNDISKAKGIIMNFKGGGDMTMFDAVDAAEVLSKKMPADTILHFGAVIDENIKDEIQVSLIATGFSDSGI